jgi:hypothetical protein
LPGRFAVFTIWSPNGAPATTTSEFIPLTEQQAYDRVVDASAADVRLVIVGGKALYGTEEAMKLFSSFQFQSPGAPPLETVKFDHGSAGGSVSRQLRFVSHESNVTFAERVNWIRKRFEIATAEVNTHVSLAPLWEPTNLTFGS